MLKISEHIKIFLSRVEENILMDLIETVSKIPFNQGRWLFDTIGHLTT